MSTYEMRSLKGRSEEFPKTPVNLPIKVTLLDLNEIPTGFIPAGTGFLWKSKEDKWFFPFGPLQEKTLTLERVRARIPNIVRKEDKLFYPILVKVETEMGFYNKTFGEDYEAAKVYFEEQKAKIKPE